MSDTPYDRLCSAVEYAEKSVEFYRDELDGCPDGLGREVFETLMERSEDNLDFVSAIQEAVGEGAPWDAACSLPGELEESLKETFISLAAKYEGEACTTESGTAELGLEMEKGVLDFYSEWEDEADDETERQFAKYMAGVQRDSVNMLSDLVYYYEDPEGWSMSGSLDGA